MRRREFITLIGGAATAWPIGVRGQQTDRPKRVGVLLPAAADDPVFQAYLGAFLQELALLGWTIGRNVRIDTRWATSDAAEIRRHVAELVALAPDVILANGASTVAPVLQATSRVPVVFPFASDPVGAGFVDNLSRPGGNATGFMNYEYNLSGKWLELLKEVAPSVTRVAVLRDTTQGSEAWCYRDRSVSRRSKLPQLSLYGIPADVRIGRILRGRPSWNTSACLAPRIVQVAWSASGTSRRLVAVRR
jgi:ABC-type uncharacterized transport system substrate-binding protein